MVVGKANRIFLHWGINMIKFSLETKSFYDLELNYPELPTDLVKITDEQHSELLKALNSGCIIFADLTYSDVKPSQFHEWNGTDWLDSRTNEEKLAYKRSKYPSLTRYQFLRCLLENGYKSEAIETQILTIEDEFTRELTLLGFKEATNFVRTDDSILTMRYILGLSDEKVDEMWVSALKQ